MTTYYEVIGRLRCIPCGSAGPFSSRIEAERAAVAMLTATPGIDATIVTVADDVDNENEEAV